MEPTKNELQVAKDRLDTYAEIIKSGDDLHPEDDALELDVDGGRIWLHPDEDGTTVDIHLFDDEGDQDLSPARSRLMSHLTHELDAPHRGECEPYTPFLGNERINIRVNLKYLR